MGQKGNILFIDEDDDNAKLLRYNLRSEGFDVLCYTRVDEVNEQDYTQMRLIIVNAMQQDFTGFDLLRKLKSDTKTELIPLIIYTQPEGEELILRALDEGAEDILLKTFTIRESLARINAVLRRYPYQTKSTDTKVINGITIRRLDLHVDMTNRKVVKSGIVVPLTKTEYSILEFLIKHLNNFYTRDDIYSQVWKDDTSVNPRIVDTNISRLRKKLGDASKSIINRYGLGYAFVDDEAVV